MSDIQPIETRYKGCRFRSRLEARWAVFFDFLGIQWEYENEGYKLQAGPYLPDFWLPQVKMFAEVKAREFSTRELTLCMQLCVELKTPVLLLDGLPAARLYLGLTGREFNHGAWDYMGAVYDIQEDHRYWIDEGRFFCGDTLHLGEGNGDYEESPVLENLCEFDGFRPDDYRIYGNQSAINAARSARFEHGENTNG